MSVIDLRGQGGRTGGTSVLADPSGRRRRLLTGIERIVAGALVVWLCGLVVAGLGLLPAPIVPFASFAGPQSSPPHLAPLPAPRPFTGAGLQPAAPASRPAIGTRASDARGTARAPVGHRGAPGERSRGGRRAVSPKPARSGLGGLAEPTLVRPQNAPGQPLAGAPGTAGPSEAASGLSATPGTGRAGSSGKAARPGTAGKSGSALGRSSETSATQTTTSPSLPGASGSAPGHTEAYGHEKTASVPTG